MEEHETQHGAGLLPCPFCGGKALAEEGGLAEELVLVAKRVVEWMRAVDDEEDDLQYLNGSADGWGDMRETAAIAAAALARAHKLGDVE